MKKIILFLLISTILAGCSSYTDMMGANSNIKKVELDMTKNEVVNIMGKSYQRMSAFKAKNGRNIEVLSYPTVDDNAIYIFRFEDGILVEFHKEFIMPETVIRESSPE